MTAVTLPPTAEVGAGRARGGRRITLARPQLTTAQLTAAIAVAVVGGLALWFVCYALLLSGLQERHSQALLYDRVRQELAAVTAPIGGAIHEGAPVGVLRIPQIGLDNGVFVEGTASADLETGPGHLPDTALPGQAGASVIYGKSSTYGAPFANLASLKPGSTFTAITGQGSFTYTVEDVRFPGDPLPTVLSANQSRLILVGARGHGWRSGWAPTQVYYVDAMMTHGKVQPAPAGRPTAVPADMQPGANDTSRLVPLVLWLELLLVVVVAIAWAALRWVFWKTWLVGAPVLIAVLWGVTNAFMPVLPNLA